MSINMQGMVPKTQFAKHDTSLSSSYQDQLYQYDNTQNETFMRDKFDKLYLNTERFSDKCRYHKSLIFSVLL